MSEYHKPVLYEESLEWLNIQRDGVYVDATFGGGGHSAGILERLGGGGRLIVFDQDPEAGANPILKDERVMFCPSNFSYLKNWLRYAGVRRVDGILADLGVSSFQLDSAARGISFRDESLLDMRMNPAQKLTGADVVNSYSESQLQEIFSRFGELRNAKTAAKAIVRWRVEKGGVQTVQSLIDAAEPAIMGMRNKYLAQMFQAIRIEVNDEIGVLRKLLQTTVEVLADEGRLVVISYHSIEDRQVKNYMKYCNFDGLLEKDEYGVPLKCFSMVTRKPVVPAKGEITENSRARSAKLRAAIRLPRKK